MKVFVRCKECYASVKVKGRYKYGSAEIIRKYRSEKLSLGCSSCKSKHDYAVIDMRASQDHILMLIFLLITLVISILILVYMVKNYWGRSFYSYMAIPVAFAIPWTVYFTFVNSQQKNIKEFNRSVRNQKSPSLT